MTTQEEGDEGMSGFQKSLLHRLNTMQKSQTPEKRPVPSVPRNQVSRQKTFAGGESGTGNTVRSFVEELQLKRNAVTQKRDAGVRGLPERNMGGHNKPEHSSTASRDNRGDTLPGKRGGAKGKAAAPPPPAPKRNTGAPQTVPRPTTSSDSRDKGVVTANGSVNRSNMRNKAAEIASMLERNQAKPNKPAKLEKPSVAEKLVQGSVTEKPVSVSASVPKAACPSVVKASGEKTQDAVEPVGAVKPTDEPTYVNSSEARQEMLAASSVKACQPENQSSKPHPGDTETPPPAPKRNKSIHAARNIVVDSAVSAGIHSRSTGVHSGSNSGASGDGVVLHQRKTKASKASNQNASGDRGIAPMGSSSESDYSGDGKVQRSVNWNKFSISSQVAAITYTENLVAVSCFHFTGSYQLI